MYLVNGFQHWVEQIPGIPEMLEPWSGFFATSSDELSAESLARDLSLCFPSGIVSAGFEVVRAGLMAPIRRYDVAKLWVAAML